MPNPHEPPFCQSCCLATVGNFPDGGVEIQPRSDFWICDACWGQMSVFERAKLRIEVRELSRMDSMAEAMDAIRKLREEENGAGEAWRESL